MFTPIWQNVLHSQFDTMAAIDKDSASPRFSMVLCRQARMWLTQLDNVVSLSFTALAYEIPESVGKFQKVVQVAMLNLSAEVPCPNFIDLMTQFPECQVRLINSTCSTGVWVGWHIGTDENPQFQDSIPLTSRPGFNLSPAYFADRRLRLVLTSTTLATAMDCS